MVLAVLEVGCSGVNRHLQGGKLSGFEQPRRFLRQAPPWPGQAQQQSRPILRFGNGDNGIMTYRSKLALRLAAGTGAWSRGQRPR